MIRVAMEVGGPAGWLRGSKWAGVSGRESVGDLTVVSVVGVDNRYNRQSLPGLKIDTLRSVGL